MKHRKAASIPQARHGSGTLPKVGIDYVLQWGMRLDQSMRPTLLTLPAEKMQRWDLYSEWSQGVGGVVDASSRLTGNTVEDVTAKVRSSTLPRGLDLPVWLPPEKGVWEILWGLVGTKEFVIEEPLRTIVDRGEYLAHDFYRLLWEARFLAEESLNLGKAQDLLRGLTGWAFESPGNSLERFGVKSAVQWSSQSYDLVCMVLALAAQNRLISHYVFTFESLDELMGNEAALKDFERFLSSVEHWVRLGSCPIGVLIGFEATDDDMDRLTEKSPEIARRVEQSLAWSEEHSP